MVNLIKNIHFCKQEFLGTKTMVAGAWAVLYIGTTIPKDRYTLEVCLLLPFTGCARFLVLVETGYSGSVSAVWNS